MVSSLKRSEASCLWVSRPASRRIRPDESLASSSRLSGNAESMTVPISLVGVRSDPGPVRTDDLLRVMQVRYQTAPQDQWCSISESHRGLWGFTPALYS